MHEPQHTSPEAAGHGHPSSTGTLVRTLVALMTLLFLSAIVARWHLGAASTFIALLIAAIKAALVGVFFMDLRRSSPLAKLFASAGLLWLVIMFALASADYVSRSW